MSTIQFTKENPTGIRTLNHERYAEMPEYRRMIMVVDDFIKKIDAEGIDVDNRGFHELISEGITLLPYMDICKACERSFNYPWDTPTDWRDLTALPYRVDIRSNGESLMAYYRCARHHAQMHQWTCYWAVSRWT